MMKKILAVLLLLPAAVFAQVKTATIFQSNMVLQRDMIHPVWGTAAAGEKVKVSFAGQTKETTADTNGKWMVKLDPLKMSKTGEELKVDGAKNSVVLKNVLVGDVWLCSGQSNMEWWVSGSSDYKRFAEEAEKFPLIRHLKIKRVRSEVRLDDAACEKWTVCNKKDVGYFTAVGYYFARRIHLEMGVPIGLVNASWSGSTIGPFIPREGFTSDLTRPLIDKYDFATENGKKTYNEYLLELEKWIRDARADLAQGKRRDNVPIMPSLERNAGARSTQYKAMIYPLVKLPIKGVLWYQGCSDAWSGLHYEGSMVALVKTWRAAWGYEFPFYQVQLASYQPKSDPASGSGYAFVREGQYRASKALNKSDIAITFDIGMDHNIHPGNKYDVGERLALLALKNDYGKKDILANSPAYKSMTVEGDKIRLTFDYAKGLMTAKKNGLNFPVATPGVKATNFAISGADGKWYDADAVVSGETIVVSSPNVSAPVAVRYANCGFPKVQPNVYNAAGLPLIPFRTDEWKKDK